MDKLSTQKRVLIATLISFAFFIAYEYFYISKLPKNEQNATLSAKQISNNTHTTQVPTNTESQSISNAPITTNKTLVIIKSDKFEANIDELGRISKFYLNENKYKLEDDTRTQLVTDSLKPLEIRFSDNSLNQLSFVTPFVADKSEIDVTSESQVVTLTQKLNDVIVTKKITFYKSGKYDISINVSNDADYFITTGLRPSVAIDAYTVHGALLRHVDNKLSVLEDGDVDANEKYNDINVAAASDRYYTSLLYAFDKTFNVVMSVDDAKNALIFIKGSQNFNASGYIGPKTNSVLKSIDERLSDVVEYGWFTFIAKPMFKFLDFLHNYIGNWGWAIVALTIIIRVVLFPLTYKGMLSMNKLKELAPKMKELQTKYKGDPQKLNTHMMELYKKHNANPMGGCLPILLQIPIFFAIYRVLLNAIELKGAEWILWINDLSAMDPFFVLPILMGATMFLQQKLTPTTFTDPMQEKIMKFLPLIFTFFFVTFPAGLTLYWFVNNVCSVIQQIFVNKLFEKQKNKNAEAKV
ncbi:Membrane protein insertase YidC [Campylobacter majalis]|uniref:Membrane protein insertase YidC n=1 Tax=Campylobacter majalis TaxID=2790656 RepID=A0ABM8Q3J1_9BACT|nr:membrane protein insertase YidC [Campylobacter majalis]CAD7287398.1 Membrane protein insertase YidC [Campylobacter majalis]